MPHAQIAEHLAHPVFDLLIAECQRIGVGLRIKRHDRQLFQALGLRESPQILLFERPAELPSDGHAVNGDDGQLHDRRRLAAEANQHIVRPAQQEASGRLRGGLDRYLWEPKLHQLHRHNLPLHGPAGLEIKLCCASTGLGGNLAKLQLAGLPFHIRLVQDVDHPDPDVPLLGSRHLL